MTTQYHTAPALIVSTWPVRNTVRNTLWISLWKPISYQLLDSIGAAGESCVVQYGGAAWIYEKENRAKWV